MLLNIQESRTVFNLTIQEELGDGGLMCHPPVFLWFAPTYANGATAGCGDR